MAQYEIKNSNNTMYPKVCGGSITAPSTNTFIQYPSDVDFSKGIYLVPYITSTSRLLIFIIVDGVISVFSGDNVVSNTNYDFTCVKIENGNLFCKRLVSGSSITIASVLKLS